MNDFNALDRFIKGSRKAGILLVIYSNLGTSRFEAYCKEASKELLNDDESTAELLVNNREHFISAEQAKDYFDRLYDSDSDFQLHEFKKCCEHIEAELEKARVQVEALKAEIIIIKNRNLFKRIYLVFMHALKKERLNSKL